MRSFWGVATTMAAVAASCMVAHAADLPPRPAASPPPVAAATPSAWQFEVSVPGWLMGIVGQVGVGSLPSASVRVPFLDLLPHLKGIVPATVIAHNDTFVAGLDFQWAKVGANATFQSNGNGAYADLKAGTSASLTQDQTIATAFAGYRIPLGPPDLKVYGLVGARYQNLGVSVNLARVFPGALALGQPPGFAIASSNRVDWADPVVGLIAKYRINETWFLGAYGDIGGFGVGSKLTSLGAITVGYNLTKSISTELGFKALYTDYEHSYGDNGSFRYKTTMAGPLLNLTYHF